MYRSEMPASDVGQHCADPCSQIPFPLREEAIPDPNQQLQYFGVYAEQEGQDVDGSGVMADPEVCGAASQFLPRTFY